MRLKTSSQPEAGSTLVTVLIIGGICTMMIGSMLALSHNSLRSAHGRADWNAAFFHAENALQWAAQAVADASPASASNFFSTANSTLTLPYMVAARSSGTNGFKNSWVKVSRPNAAMPGVYLVTASAKVGNKVRTVQASVVKNSPSHVFDYEYFLNNWGWWWGDTITGNGGNRANWDFDFRYNPTVNGLIMASGRITQNGVPVDPLASTFPFGGTAGSDPLAMTHMGVERLRMPNLTNFANYQNKALSNTATNGIWVNGNQLVYGVHTNGSKPGLYLTGTMGHPIIISNTVVIPGDVVIKGVIKGQGTLYVGGNLYIAGDLTYANGPNWSSPPETMTSTNRDNWVTANKSADLVGFAVRGSILGGDVNSSDWKNNCFSPAGYGLANVGDESKLGEDGIAHTPDDNIPFLHSDGTTSAWYDADENGVVNSSYNYNNDIVMGITRAAKIANYPSVPILNTPVDYSSLASNNMNSLDGIFYTNHGAAMRLAKNNAIFHGAIVSRDEAIIFNNSLKFLYDSRVHSRYNQDPNRYIDLGLPISTPLAISGFTELTPDSTNL
jgi:Tfp pilus assembly protein PilX